MEVAIKSSYLEKINPFFFMTFLYMFIGVLVAFQTSLIDFQVIQTSSSLSWVRIHFITLGILTQVIFGYVPVLVNSKKVNSPRWDIWVLINLGLWMFFYGRSLGSSHSPIMITGGFIIFIATVLFILQLFSINDTSNGSMTGYFYIFGSIFFAFLISNKNRKETC